MPAPFLQSSSQSIDMNQYCWSECRLSTRFCLYCLVPQSLYTRRCLLRDVLVTDTRFSVVLQYPALFVQVLCRPPMYLRNWIEMVMLYGNYYNSRLVVPLTIKRVLLVSMPMSFVARHSYIPLASMLASSKYSADCWVAPLMMDFSPLLLTKLHL